MAPRRRPRCRSQGESSPSHVANDHGSNTKLTSRTVRRQRGVLMLVGCLLLVALLFKHQQQQLVVVLWYNKALAETRTKGSDDTSLAKNAPFVTNDSAETKVELLVADAKADEASSDVHHRASSNGNDSAVAAATTATDPVTYYVIPRTDRSGQQLRQFLLLDAYAFKHGGKVGGTCVKIGMEKRLASVHEKILKRAQDTLPALVALGLDDMFRYECPSDEEVQSHAAKLLKHLDLDWNDLLSQEWLGSLHARLPLGLGPSRSKKKQVAVHMRRGDVHPCSAWYWRYLPNSFFLQVLDTYLPQFCGDNVLDNCQVTVYSESESRESFDPFVERGYELKLDGSEGAAWQAFVTADVLFVAASGFAWAPAVFNHAGQVVYAQIGQEEPVLPGWHLIPDDSILIQQAAIQTELLKKELCSKP